MNGNHGLSPSVVETIAGFAAGISSTLVVHPLDVIKTRLQGTVYEVSLLTYSAILVEDSTQ